MRIRLHGNIDKRMAEGIEQCDIVLVFLTLKYYGKVNSNDRQENCQKELQYALRTKTADKMLIVIMEEELLMQYKWKGVFGLNFCNDMYINLTGDFADNKYISNQLLGIRTQIERKLGKYIIYSYSFSLKLLL